MVGEAAPRPEYPRPQFRREAWINLNGEWHFAFDDEDAGLAAGWHDVVLDDLRAGTSPFDLRIVVPFCYQSQRSGIGETTFHDVVWYARTCAYREGEGPPEDYLWHMGMYDLEPAPGGGFHRIETPVMRAFRDAAGRTSGR